MTLDRPAMVTRATWLAAAVIAMTGVTAVLTLVFEDELVDAWAEGRSTSSSIEPPAFVPVAVTMFVVVALLGAVLIALLRHGHEWARVVMSALVVLVAIATLAILRTSPPAVFVVVSAASLLVDVAALLALWHRDTRAFCRHHDAAATGR